MFTKSILKVYLVINCKVVDCNHLNSIVLGSNTFALGSSFRIINNNNLVTIDIGDGTFGGNAGVADSTFELTSIFW